VDLNDALRICPILRDEDRALVERAAGEVAGALRME
jgi:hypothetical protein